MTKVYRFIYLLLIGVFLAPLAHAEFVDITPSVEISQSRQALDRVNRQLYSYVTIQNTSGVTIEAPLQLNIIDPNIPILNADGLSSDFHSYIQLNEDLLAGEEKTVRVNFELARGRLSFGLTLNSDKPVIQMSGDRFYNPPSSVRNITERLENEGKVFSPYVDGAFVVWFVNGTSLSRVQQIAESISASVQGSAGDNEYLLVTSNTNLTLSEMSLLKRQLEEFAEVALVTVNYLSSTGSDVDNTVEIPSDSGNKQYYLKEAGIQDAWVELTEMGKIIGGIDKRIGVLDDVLVDASSDFFGKHPDLNIRGLSDECILNGAANIAGCLTAIQSSEESILNISPDRDNRFNTNERNESHGTHVTGIIGAEHGNGEGISGIMHKKKILFARAGLGLVSSIFSVHTAQILLIEELGAHILNMSIRSLPRDINADDGTQYCLFSKGYLSDLETPDLWIQSKIQSKCKNNEFGDSPAYAMRIKDFLANPSSYPRFPISNVPDFQSLQREYRDLAFNETLFYKKADEKWSKTIIVHAAGNENQSASYNTSGPCGVNNNLSGPGYSPVTLCVAALKKPGTTGVYEFSDFSNNGAQVDIATFGVDIYSTILEYDLLLGDLDKAEEYGMMNGTSQAAPIITGIAGLIWNAYPNLTASQVKDAIINGVSKAGSVGLRNCALRPNDLKQTALHDSTQDPVPVANAYCALKYAENLNQQRLQPQNLEAIPADAEVELRWDTVQAGTTPITYNLYYSLDPSFTGDITNAAIVSKISGITMTNKTVTGLENGKTYHFVVTAEDASGESVLSNKVSTVPMGNSPSPADTDMVSAGRAYHSCMTRNLKVVCWGDNTYGQVQPEGSALPASLQNVIQVGAGFFHSCALDLNVGVKCWGDNRHGQLNVPLLVNPVKLSVGGHHACAIDDSGVQCWGYQTSFHPNLQNPTIISLSSFTSCAIDDNGLHCWGAIGLLDVPDDLQHPTEVANGGFHACVIDINGMVCWGSRSDMPSDLVNPEQISTGSGFGHICAIDGTSLRCWRGYSGGYTSTLVVDNLINPRQLSAGNGLGGVFSGRVCAIDDLGVYCWDKTGQLNVPGY